MMRGFGDRERSYGDVVHLFNDTFRNRAPISKSTAYRTCNRFERTGSVKDEPRSGRPKTATNEQKSLEVILNFQENPHTSSRKVAQQTEISKTSVLQILKSHRYHPYKIKLVQELIGDDHDRRLEYYEEMMLQFDRNNQFLFWTCFSDEATFELSGSVNRHNMRYWTDENPHWMREHRTQYPEKVNVWAGILCNRIIGPFFIDGNLTSEKYVNLLNDNIIPAIQAIVGDAFENVWFQQDGAQVHFALIVRNVLNNVFPDRWIGRRGTIEWPPRSPDLSPLDFFYWGYLKSKVFETKPNDIEELKHRIVEASNDISLEKLQNVSNGFIICWDFTKRRVDTNLSKERIKVGE
ncbi:PREDICTED: uncharacterized protein LOC105557041 [Vollenhovia emeryi]|uniref:uncharacterized protein LOC105557041 n=1 Tax=Vollenhovia emeryi TaxID=411798 RepID=UPI0005F52BC8|nr:PREDICTED: uncharacterized protein LOC105557041 [Vollenhovia emeryi]